MQLCTRKVRDFAIALRARKVFGAFEKRPPVFKMLPVHTKTKSRRFRMRFEERFPNRINKAGLFNVMWPLPRLSVQNDRAEKRLRMRHLRPSRETAGAEISTWATHSEWDSRVSWLCSKISVGFQVWNCSVQEICLSTLTGRSFAKVWSLCGQPRSYPRKIPSALFMFSKLPPF